MNPSRRLQRRRDRRQVATSAARYDAERYKTHRAYSAHELRTILVEDAVARRPTPLLWALLAYRAIAEAERTTEEQVFQQVRAECVELTGLDLPFSGLR